MFDTIVDNMQYYRIGLLTKADGCGVSIGFNTE